jgi:hypothetical protein
VWTLVAVAAGLWTAALVRLTGPAVIDPDGHASVLYFDRVVSGARLEVPLLSTPKPMLTLTHGLAWTLTGDWRAVTLVTVVAFAVAVAALARAAFRLGGPVPSAAVAVAVAGSAPLLLQVARGNSVIFALAGWAVALDALARPERRWLLGGVALLAAGLARSETWLLLPPLVLWVLWEVWRGRRSAAWVLIAVAGPALWLGHDWLLTGDALYSSQVPGRYTDLVAGRNVIPPAEFASMVADRYLALPVQLALGAVGLLALVRRRAWVWLCGLGLVAGGILVVLGAYVRQGVYASWRYYDPTDTTLRVLAAIGVAELIIGLLAAVAALVRRAAADDDREELSRARAFRRVARRPVPSVDGQVAGPIPGVDPLGPDELEHEEVPEPPLDATEGAPEPEPEPEPPSRAGTAVRVAVAAVAALVAAVGVVATLWPAGPADPVLASTLDRDQRLSANAHDAIAALRPLATDGRAITVSGPQRARAAVELGLPLVDVRDLFLAVLSSPADGAVAGTVAVFHDADGDRPFERYTGLNRATAGAFGIVLLDPILVDPARGLYVLEVRTKADPSPPVGGEAR